MTISRNEELGFRQSHAFVIGINQYPSLDSNLKTAVSDAEEIAMRLKVLQGFDQVLLLKDVSKAQIEQLINWMKKPDRPTSLTIRNRMHRIRNRKFKSDISQIKLTHELTKSKREKYPVLTLITDQGTAEERAETLYRAPVNKANIEIKEEDSIIFYYAGHGFPGEVTDGPAGFLAPCDARNKLVNNKSLLPMNEVYQALSILKCKHTLLILDCCFAGKFRFTKMGRGEPIPFLMPMYQRRYERYKKGKAWQVLVSSGPEEEANDSAKWANIRDHSPFAKVLIDALEGKADVPLSGNHGKDKGDGIITATELFLYVWDQVEQITSQSKPQHPGLFPMAQHREGEFIFINPKIDADRFNFADDPDKNPYKGLLPYQQEDAPLFFGREKAVKEVVRRLEEVNILFITGPSGSGKSSLVRAGVIPALRDVEHFIEIKTSDLLPPKNSEEETTQLSKHLKKHLSSPKKCLFLVDQYEELFSHPLKTQLQSQIISVLHSIEKQHRIIFTIRADYEWQIKGNSQLKDYWHKKRIYRIPPMDLDELRAALTGPAWWAMYDFKNEDTTDPQDDGEMLINEILDDLTNAPGALPLLSFTMHAFYEFSKKNNRERRLLLSDYTESLAGVEGALSVKADEVYKQLSAEEKKIMQALVIRMVNIYDGAFVRRRVYYTVKGNAFSPLAGSTLHELDFSKNHELVDKVIAELVLASLLVQTEDEQGQPFVEPAHDALISHWGQCRIWLDQFGKDNLILQRQLWQAAVDHQKMLEKNFRHNTAAVPIPAKELDVLTNSSLLWDNNPKLLQVLNEIDFRPAFAKEEELTTAFDAILKKYESPAIRPGLSSNAQKNEDFFAEVFALCTDGALIDLFKDAAHWLNNGEIYFIIESWQRKEDRIFKLKAERDAAKRTAKRALANTLAFQAQLTPDRRATFRLAEIASEIDPSNVKALDLLLKSFYNDREPVHYSLLPSAFPCFTNDSSEIITSYLNFIIFRNATTGWMTRFWKTDSTHPIDAMAISESGKHLATCTRNSITVWERPANNSKSAKWKKINTWTHSVNEQERPTINLFREKKINFFHTHIKSIYFTNNDQNIFYSCIRPLVKKEELIILGNWNKKSPKIIYKKELSFSAKQKYQPDFLISSDGNLIYDQAKAIVLEAKEKGNTIEPSNESSEPGARKKFAVRGFFSKNSPSILAINQNKQLIKWHIKNGSHKIIASLPTTIESKLTSIAFSENRSLFAFGTADGNIHIYKYNEKLKKPAKKIYEGIGHHQETINIGFSPNGSQMVSQQQDGSVKIWDLGEKFKKNLKFDYPINSSKISFLNSSDNGHTIPFHTEASRDFKYFVQLKQIMKSITSFNSVCEIYESSTKAIIKKINLGDVSTGVFTDFSTDNKLLALAYKNTVKILAEDQNWETITNHSFQLDVSGISFLGKPPKHFSGINFINEKEFILTEKTNINQQETINYYLVKTEENNNETKLNFQHLANDDHRIIYRREGDHLYIKSQDQKYLAKLFSKDIKTTVAANAIDIFEISETEESEPRKKWSFIHPGIKWENKNSIIFYADSSKMISIGNGIIKLWNLKTGRQELELAQFPDVKAGFLSVDDSRLLVFNAQEAYILLLDKNKIKQKVDIDGKMGILEFGDMIRFDLDQYFIEAGIFNEKGRPKPIIEKRKERLLFNLGLYYLIAHSGEITKLRERHNVVAAECLEAAAVLGQFYPAEVYVYFLENEAELKSAYRHLILEQGN
ncbi:MAG: caspase family protein [Bacteroidota bacterium]